MGKCRGLQGVRIFTCSTPAINDPGQQRAPAVGVLGGDDAKKQEVLEAIPAMNKRGAPAAPPDSVDFLPRVPKGPVRPERRGNEDAEEKRERMEDPVAAGLVKVKQCGLCALEFEEHNLPGVVSFQAIAYLRKQWGSGLPESDARLRSASARYSSVKLCAFCYQHFVDAT
ncbi:hypothetical protein T484DRAFT_1915748 [Baffinella frigidus]|nr:hypothetical protein T484DRAFT_1915748 [Cryptophyta sp. CCMP2293]